MNTQIKLIVVALCFVAGITKVAAQGQTSHTNTEIKPIKVGDKVPNLYLGEVLNHSTLKEAHINDFEGKLLILDFWNTRCSNCIALWPKLEKLQKEFDGKIALLPVGFDATEKGEIKKFLAKRKGTDYDLKIPSSIANSPSLHNNYFTGIGFPRVVWISPSGELLGITGADALNASNIKRVLNGEKLNLKITSFLPTRRIVATIDSNSIDYFPRRKFPIIDIGSRFILGAIDTIFPSTLSCNSTSDYIRFTAANTSIFNIYIGAYNMLSGDNSIENEIVNKGNYKRAIIENGTKPFYTISAFGKDFDNWQREEYNKHNVVSYDLLLPPTSNQKSGAKMVIQDLDRYLGIESSIQTRKVKCFALVRTSKIDKLKSKTAGYFDFEDLAVKHGKKLSYQPIATLVEGLNMIYTSSLILDETNYQDRIDMNIDLKRTYTLPELRSILKKYDLDLVEVERGLPMLVLKDMRK